jgi:F0F1-type ATP synthase assembly protein I
MERRDDMVPWSEIERRIPWLLLFGFVPGFLLGVVVGWLL